MNGYVFFFVTTHFKDPILLQLLQPRPEYIRGIGVHWGGNPFPGRQKTQQPTLEMTHSQS